jgi:Tol biopolymer transport system component
MLKLAQALLVVSLIGCQSGGEPPTPAQPASPPQTDIHLFALSAEGVAPVARVTDRDGYDNQPLFTPDGERLLFTSDREGQMDTFAYSPISGALERITRTMEGEYSPTVLPDDEAWFSTIRMDTAGVQELWQYPLADGTPARIADIDRVGYHTWIGSDRILFFRLGRPSTLQLVTKGTADTTIVATNVGRSLHRIPGEFASSYTQSSPNDYVEILRYDWETGESASLAAAIDGHQDYAWTPDGEILMAVEGVLYGYTPGESVEWREIADLGLTGTSRIAVSPDGQLLAVVAERAR